MADREKIYGISFDVTDPELTCTREYDAAGMQNDYVVGSAFAHGGRNDFDNAFPWCDMRLCAVKTENGVRKVTYADDCAFSRTGERGAVMVEIPKFYSRRAFDGDREIWAVSGAMHDGFSVDGAFRVGNEVKEKIYVGVYKANLDGAPSRSGVFPTTGLYPRDFLRSARALGFELLTYRTLLMIQKLIAIEFAFIRMNMLFGGNSVLPYNCASAGDHLTLCAVGKNTVSVDLNGNWDRHTLELLHEGQQVGVGNEIVTFTRAVTITKREIKDGVLTLTYGGEDLSGSLRAGEDRVYGLPQKTGQSDALSYHTGRLDFVPGRECSHFANSFRWRFIEDVWGNVWEWVYGLKIHRLRYYVSNDPACFDESGVDGFEKAPFPAPDQPYLGESNRQWIVRQSRDKSAPDLMLPTVCGESAGGGYGRYFSAGFYSFYDHDYRDRPVDPDAFYWACCGSGWDHRYYGSLFTLRCFMQDVGDKYSTTKCNSLYGGRAVLF